MIDWRDDVARDQARRRREGRVKVTCRKGTVGVREAKQAVGQEFLIALRQGQDRLW